MGSRDPGTLYLCHGASQRRDQQHSPEKPADHSSPDRCPPLDPLSPLPPVRCPPLDPLSYHVVATSFDQDDHVLIHHLLPIRSRRRWAAHLILLTSAVVFSDEWKARHPLIPPSGVMNLPEPPSPAEVFFSGPQSPADSAAWLAGLKAWRTGQLIRFRYDDAQYKRPELAWTQQVFSQVQSLIWDRTFYDPETGEYTVDRFLDDTERRVGPIDAVLIWHVYPTLGVDDRNQFDLLRDLPGGIPAIRQMVQKFHSHGVKVFFPFITWDTGTREEATPAWVALAQLLKDVDADGVNFDTLESVPVQFRLASDATGHPLALEPQFDIRDE